MTFFYVTTCSHPITNSNSCPLANPFACVCSTDPQNSGLTFCTAYSRCAHVPESRPYQARLTSAPPDLRHVPGRTTQSNDRLYRRRGKHLRRGYCWTVVQPCARVCLIVRDDEASCWGERIRSHGRQLRMLLWVTSGIGERLRSRSNRGRIGG